MLSGNGRHRRPRQAPALVVAAGVTGSAIAIPLFAASGASAASSHAWDRLADCESGGQWSMDAGNGYYGGFQLTQDMWDRYGGLDYAPRPDLASRSQQIAVAEKILDDKGLGAWPSCSVTAGLAGDDGSVDVDPGVSESPSVTPSADPSASSSPSSSPSLSASTDSSSPSSDSSDSSTAPSATSSAPPSDGSGSGSGSGEKDHGESGNSGVSDAPSDGASGRSGAPDTSGSDSRHGSPSDSTPGPTATDTSGNPTSGRTDTPSTSSGESGKSDNGAAGGRHRGGRASDDGASDSRAGEGRHASRDDDRSGGAYTVRSGDNLSDIADAHDVHGGWPALYELNKKVVGSDPDLILPGQSLDLGVETGEK
ncbi:transglycosylase family protein [Streptomyces beihaiensis]|uniref:Transglycosylase family protein n=1 Tax=Streptomyces beihaiensis TaxID=2984495 RepID=A0ABT3U296_9ACTN|nr:transglycosylase family protein [Streptomyces beihaiensis]MCX3063440.1 transglycosylase family protein [Streptomyces beihaiensis]